jgi:hypothetical protein
MPKSSTASKVRSYFENEFENGTLLLQQLPHPADMGWFVTATRDPSMAIKIGKSGDNTVAAFLADSTNAFSHVGYALYHQETLLSVGHSDLKQVKTRDLFAPFRHIVGPTSEEKGRLSNVIRWYYIDSGLMKPNIIEPDTATLENFCKQLYSALSASEHALVAANLEPKPSKKDCDTTTPTTVAPMTHLSSANPPEVIRKAADTREIENFLQVPDLKRFLDSIPPVDKMHFSIQPLFAEYEVNGLRIAQRADGSIFACIGYTQGDMRIDYLIRPKDHNKMHTWIEADAVLKSELEYPFNICYMPGLFIRGIPKQRLDFLAGWYLLASSIVRSFSPEIVLNLDESTLSYISKQMGAAFRQPYRPTTSQLIQAEENFEMQTTEILQRIQEVSSKSLPSSTVTRSTAFDVITCIEDC